MTQPLYFNRELSWIEFNRRVLEQAKDRELPLLARLKFIAIVSSNFDEFFMVRVASVKRQFKNGNYVGCPSGMSPLEQLKEIRLRIKQIVKEQYEVLLGEILPELANQGIVYYQPENYSELHKLYSQQYFRDELFPLLTPVRLEPGEAYINFSNLRLHVAFRMKKVSDGNVAEANDEKERIAIVQVPSSLNRILYLPEEGNVLGFTFLEQIIIEHAEVLFPGYSIIDHLVFRLTRDADFSIDETNDEGFVEAMEQVLHHRNRSTVVRLNVSNTSGFLRKSLQTLLRLEDSEVFEVKSPLDPGGFMEIAFLRGFDHLREEAWKPVDSIAFPDDKPVCEVIREGDKLLCLPYESFQPVIRMVQEAAVDPQTLAIKMTLYRTGGDSPIVQALETAARNGKHVTVLVEIKARFDEQQNIEWAEKLSEAGVIVIFGIVGLKVHAKALLIIRREEKGIKRYLHLSTGNYNDKTAKIYSDICLFTCRDDLSYDAGLFFNAITGYSVIPVLAKLSMAPNSLKPRLLHLIEREAERSFPGEPGVIIAKLNSLVDVDVIEALYKASQRGVHITLNIRGVCMLVPGVTGVSENIRVFSIVDRFLEHTRVFYFRNGRQDEVYLSSADWMPRNLEGRVELMFPVEDAVLKETIKEMLDTYGKDSSKAMDLQSDGTYLKVELGKKMRGFNAQEVLYRSIERKNVRSKLENKMEFEVRRRPPKT